MGMFDHIQYNGHEYQTKDTPKQLCDYYAIEGGELWYQEYDAEWVKDDSSFLGSYLKQSNHRWVRCTDFTDTIYFYRDINSSRTEWEELLATVENGRVVKIEKVKK